MARLFPGMDPYLEDPAFWEDFHRRFITQLADDLLEHLPANYDAHIDERIRLVESESETAEARLPDVSVDRLTHPYTEQNAAEKGSIATLEPVTIPMLSVEEHRDVWIEIQRLPERELVTAIEVLSPTNKQGKDAADYHAKRLALHSRKVNLVEIDLLRGGKRLVFAEALPAGDYFAFVTRGSRHAADVYPWRLRDRLPAIPIPLQTPDPDITLDLSAVFAAAYERGRYWRRLRYNWPVRPPFSVEDGGWVSGIVGERAHGMTCKSVNYFDRIVYTSARCGMPTRMRRDKTDPMSFISTEN